MESKQLFKLANLLSNQIIVDANSITECRNQIEIYNQLNKNDNDVKELLNNQNDILSDKISMVIDESCQLSDLLNKLEENQFGRFQIEDTVNDEDELLAPPSEDKAPESLKDLMHSLSLEEDKSND